MTEVPTMRIGQGFDVHPFSDDPDRAIVLAGITFEGPGLSGHSDADVVAHAVIDALLGAAGLGDIGQRYPDSDTALAGADSMVLLAALWFSRLLGWHPVVLRCRTFCPRWLVGRSRSRVSGPRAWGPWVGERVWPALQLHYLSVPIGMFHERPASRWLA